MVSEGARYNAEAHSRYFEEHHERLGADELPGRVNYLIGNEPAHWQRGVPLYTAVEVQEAYPGIKLVHYGNQRQFEYDFVVAPGADPGLISFRVSDADRIEIDAQGDLLLKLGADQIRQKRPLIYQEEHGRRREIEGGYAVRENATVLFQIGAYNPDLPLIIDPVLTYSSYLGGLANETARARRGPISRFMRVGTRRRVAMLS